MKRNFVPRWISPGSPVERLQRREPSRQPNPRILILPEGHNEANYFVGLAKEVGALSVRIDEARGVPQTLVKRGLEVQEENRRLVGHDELPVFDQIWCVFDGGDEHPRVREAQQLASKSKIRMAISFPCFEVWLLLHLENLTTRPLITPQKAKQRLWKYYPPKKYGTDTNICPYSLVNGRFEVAIKRARLLNKYHDSHGGVPDPSSNVYALVENILKIGEKRRFRHVR